ncbi:MAG: S41 family peptidase [Pseudomonadota bacterium]
MIRPRKYLERFRNPFSAFIILFFVLQSVNAKDEESQNHPTPLPFDELSAFADAYNRIKSVYVEDVDDKKLLEGAIAGMMAALDPHSSFLDSSAFTDLQSSTKGEYGGLGIEVAPDSGFIKIVSPMENTPAERSGILAGDLIIKIDDFSVKDVPLGQAIEKMRGKIGDPVLLTIVRKGIESPIDIEVVRDVIKVTSVRGELLGDDYGYVKINQFQHKTGEDFRQKLANLQELNKKTLKGLILDLRNNPGGVLSAAVDVSDALLKEGIIVSTRGRAKESASIMHAKPDDLMSNAPIVVLINNGSASGSEIVAGALQDNKRALIVGTRSFGKGSVQTLLPIHGDAALKLTTARYYTPSGHSIQGEGIVPDIETPLGKWVVEDTESAVFESDLPGSLSNDTNPNKIVAGVYDNPLVKSDSQIKEAVHLLKGYTLLSFKN